MGKKKPVPVAETVKIIQHPRKIAILGTASQSVSEAPYEDQSWKIWNMSANFTHGKRFDLWFELHTPEVLAASHCDPKYFDFLKNAGQSLVAGHPNELRWPKAQQFPIVQLVERFGDYYTCTAALMLAYALYLHQEDTAAGGIGIAEVGLWGIHMQVDEEYAYQKPCVEYWIGYLRASGIKVSIADQAPICRTNAIYAFDNLKLSREFTERMTELRIHMPKQEAKLAAMKAEVAKQERDMLEERAAERLLKQIAHLWAL